MLQLLLGGDKDCDERADELFEEEKVKCWIDGKTCWADDYKQDSDEQFTFFIVGGCFCFLAGGCFASFLQMQVYNASRQQQHQQQQQSRLVEIAPGGAAYAPGASSVASSGIAAPPATLMQVLVPAGAKEGTTIRVQAPSGQMVDVQLPPGTQPGQQITVSI